MNTALGKKGRIELPKAAFSWNGRKRVAEKDTSEDIETLAPNLGKGFCRCQFEKRGM